ncbi:transmembrane channel-like protein 7 [Lampris incognitus]|uniref:transmembrane channel-like protein 7 n=1 Tax=Lampris incognitus TaxID=2546036 RepID=UPI0024B5904B|nr:transmembrane channel-like protein 7 [Lampris incognitus]
MEEHKTVNFTRLLSDESGSSILSEESYVYYQTEIFDQLPSSKAARPQQSRQEDWEACKTPRGSQELENIVLLRGFRDKVSHLPPRCLPTCMQQKREVRDARKLEICSIGSWEAWRRSRNINRRRVWAHLRRLISGLLPWKLTLHIIEGRFGGGVKAYFVFLRYLLFLNLLHCVLIWAFILGPTTFYGRGNIIDSLRFEGNDSVLDFFLGSGFLERSPVFYKFYTLGSLNLTCLNTPLLFLGGILIILFLSLIMVVRRTMVGFKHSWLLGNHYSVNVSYKIFCGWDFAIQDPATAGLKRSFIRNDLKLYVEDRRFYLREGERTLTEWVLLYLLRIILNLVVLSLLGGAFFLIFFASKTAQACDQKIWLHWWSSLFFQYLPPFVITSVNLILPQIFRKISSFEDYSLAMQVNMTLVRSIFLKLGSLGIYLFFLLKPYKQTVFSQCWENQFGRAMYKLCIFDFLASLCKTFLLIYPRMLLQRRYPSSWLTRLLGKQRFLIPFNVLDLVHSQTISWVGVYYCPLLPFIEAVKLVATFYMKKITVLRACVPEHRMFRSSSSSFLFHFMLLLGLLMAAVTLGFSLYQFSPSSTCGPFGGGASVFNVTAACVNSLPRPAQSTLQYLASEAFALPLILAEIVILTSYVSRGRANQRAIERLKDILVMSSSDKRFLVKQHATILKAQRKTQKKLAANMVENSPVE